MGYFVPMLKNNKHLAYPLQFNGYKYNFIWPLSENSPWWQRCLKGILILISLCFYVLTIAGEYTFVLENGNNIPDLADCLSTTFMGTQYIFRISVWVKRQNEMRALYRRFYKQIYFIDTEDADFNKEIKNYTRFVDFFTKLYYVPMMLLYMMFGYEFYTQGMASRDKPHIYRMSIHWYDAQAPLPYIFTAVYSGWLCWSCVGVWAADDFSLCVMLCHASYRYKALQKNLGNLLKEVREEAAKCLQPADQLHTIFRRKLYQVLSREQKLKSFIDEAKQHFTYAIFCCLFFGVLLQCVVLFQLQSSTFGVGWLKYIAWLISQVSELIMIGHFGQMLMDEASAMQNSYYMCQWEKLLPYGNQLMNKSLMLDIRSAIQNAETPVVFDGLRMFALSHSTVGTALRSAMSYFMFLNTMNDAEKPK
ncbi:odorant receptor 74a-like [Teleopsis dalmanni]|uniref:odorant receptor 74a-like n=1 Tax=Teleopsis dalmanni TaxID=139649 RepID=UPI0018CEDDC4|nr:odorant receptor 74a-like [Teleopsis dalmanni]